MRNRSFTASCVAILFMSATFFASLLYLPQFMEKQFGYSPLEAGVGILPFLGVFAVVSFVAGPLYNRLGAKPLAVFGAACITVAPFLFSQVDAGASYGSLVPGMVVLGLGVGSFYPTATTAGVTSVDDSQTSLAGGIVYMFQIAGGSIGLGLTTTVFSAHVPPFVDGIQAAFRLDAALSLVGFLISLLFVGGTLLRRRRPREPPERRSAQCRRRRASFDRSHRAGCLPRGTDQPIVTGTSDQPVVPGTAVERVGVAVTDQEVVASAARELVRGRHRRRACRRLDRRAG